MLLHGENGSGKSSLASALREFIALDRPMPRPIDPLAHAFASIPPGFLLYRVKHQQQDAVEHSRTAVRIEPHNPFARFDLGAALFEHGDFTNALIHLAEAARLLPNGYDQNYSAQEMHFILAQTQYRLALYAECVPALETVLRLTPEHPRANYLMAMARVRLGETRSTLPYLQQAIRSEPPLAQLPDFFDLLSRNYVSQGAYDEGLKASEKASRLAVKAGHSQQAAKLDQRAQECRRRLGQVHAAASGDIQ